MRKDLQNNPLWKEPTNMAGGRSGLTKYRPYARWTRENDLGT